MRAAATVVATGPYAEKGFGCPALGTRFFAAPGPMERPAGPVHRIWSAVVKRRRGKAHAPGMAVYVAHMGNAAQVLAHVQ
jgi:hypothetical protein